jgi:glutamate formiminotransferase/formiminotetrahydrofolate cyclodeaminase
MPTVREPGKPLIECVPNFSEGKDRSKIDRIVSAISAVPGVAVLDVDPGVDTNRTVVTVVGAPEPMVEAAFAGIRAAADLIDMRQHRGAHPRMGATDVCPFVPISGITEAECVVLARRLGERVGRELSIPVYLYESAATAPYRRNLSEIRAGEYEGFAAKMRDPKWAPDFGPVEFQPRSGATVIGVRPFLIAYNVNLNTRDTKIANEISGNIRESGRPMKDGAGNPVLHPDGTPKRTTGRLKECKATGWYIDAYQRAQISINLTDFHVTPPHVAFDVCCEEAEKLGARVTGSELVGLIPLEALVSAGQHYLKKQKRSWGLPESWLVETAIQSLGLRELGPFNAEEKVIEYRLEGRMGRLISMPVHQFVDECSTETPTPGGGSVAALAGSLAAGLAAMVANLTQGKKKFLAVHEEMVAIAVKGQQLKNDLIAAVDRDTEAFDKVMAAMKMPKGTPEQELERGAAIEKATVGAAEVPLSVLEKIPSVLELARVVAEKGNPNSRSDAGVAASMARAAAEGAYLNVRINIAGLKDRSVADKLGRRAEEVLFSSRSAADTIWKICTTE